MRASQLAASLLRAEAWRSPKNPVQDARAATRARPFHPAMTGSLLEREAGVDCSVPGGCYLRSNVIARESKRSPPGPPRAVAIDFAH